MVGGLFGGGGGASFMGIKMHCVHVQGICKKEDSYRSINIMFSNLLVF